MSGIDGKKLLIKLMPFVLFFFLANKSTQAYRLAAGTDISEKLLGIQQGFGTAFSSPLPSLHTHDLIAGAVGALLIMLYLYSKKINAKKYRKGIEYGSARWGNKKDIQPYIDPIFRNNAILTKTERLTMESRPKNPAYARNKNMLVLGGSGSGKTRFFLKPNLMQMHSSYVVTDSKGLIQ